MADEELMELISSGDQHAFEVIFERHGGPSFSLAYRICGTRARAEEIVQDAFLSLWRSGARYDRARGSVRSWILSVVHNRAIDAIRHDAVRVSRDVADDALAERMEAAERTDEEVERRDDAGRIHSALLDLPQEQRRVIELSYFGGFTHVEIAKILALPEGTVKGRMRLGLTKLRLTLEPRSIA